LLVAFSPRGAYSLGLGKIEVKSRFNQPLRAEIVLHGVRQVPLEDIQVKLASSEEFLQAGIDRALVLSKLHFYLMRKETGETVVEVTSQDPIREPFLDFLATVVWPQGRLLREYAVLLELPLPQGRKSPSVSAAMVSRQSKTELAEAEGVSRNVSTREAWAGWPVADSATASSTSKITFSTYGPIEATDTLWLIAQRLLQPRSSITPQQMMLALQEVNPDAFLHNNINGLKVGKVLKVPTAGEVLKLTSAAEAIRQVQQQNQIWGALGSNGKLGGHTQPIKLESSKEKSGVLGGEGEEAKILTAQDQNLQQKAVPEANGSKDEIADLRARLLQVSEILDNRAQENEKMQALLREMEQQVKALRALLSVKDSPLAGAQEFSEEQWKELKLVNALTNLSVKESGASILPSPIAIESPSSSQGTSEVIPNFSPQIEAMSNLMKLAERDVSEAESAFSIFITSRNLSVLGGSSVLLLLLIIWRMRKRKILKFEAEQEVNWCELVEVWGRRIDKMAEGPAAVQVEVYETIAEANRHLAANQHHEAVKILKAALGREPERQELKLKLAEVYYAMGNESAFVALINEWAPNQDKNNVIWAKLVKMGRILSPNHQLFTNLQQNDERNRQNLEIVSSEHSSELTLPLLTFDEETTELFSSTGELALEVQISEPENGTLEVDLSGIDLIKHDISADAVIDEIREKYEEEKREFPPSNFSHSLFEKEETQKKSLDIDFANINVNAISDGDAEEIKASFPGKALMDDLDEIEIKLDLARAYIDMDDTEGACNILEEVIAAGNEEQRGAGQDLLIKLAKVS
jgi:pilus assembly protein FimV